MERQEVIDKVMALYQEFRDQLPAESSSYSQAAGDQVAATLTCAALLFAANASLEGIDLSLCDRGVRQ